VHYKVPTNTAWTGWQGLHFARAAFNAFRVGVFEFFLLLNIVHAHPTASTAKRSIPGGNSRSRTGLVIGLVADIIGPFLQGQAAVGNLAKAGLPYTRAERPDHQLSTARGKQL
jgi:hypothetical protein